MEINNLLKKKKIVLPERRRKLYYIALIKFLAMIKIIKWHVIIWTKKPIDYGARMCEILFISSGFLVGYNYYSHPLPCTYVSSVKYVYKHLRSFYPLEMINTLYGFFLYKGKSFNLTEIEILISNLLLMKSWSRFSQLASCFNGISWFLSALIFCYFLTPILLKAIEKWKSSLILFFLISALRISIEEFINKGALNMFDVHFHRGPIIRLLEFFLGLLMIPTYFSLKSKINKFENNKWFKIIFTFIQIFLFICSYYLMLIYNNILSRCYFVLIFCVFIFISGFDYGYLSDCISNRICQDIMSCQMEMYLLQNTINHITNTISNYLNCHISLNTEIEFLLKLVIIFIIGFFYRKFAKETFSRYFDSLIFKIKKSIFD